MPQRVWHSKKFGNNKLNVDIFMKSSLGWYVSPRPDNWKPEKQKNMDVTSLGNQSNLQTFTSIIVSLIKCSMIYICGVARDRSAQLINEV